jgi:hypothetical protein
MWCLYGKVPLQGYCEGLTLFEKGVTKMEMVKVTIDGVQVEVPQGHNGFGSCQSCQYSYTHIMLSEGRLMRLVHAECAWLK